MSHQYYDPYSGTQNSSGALRIGSSGKAVEDLQNALNSTGNYNLDVDGQYGQLTANAVRDYQTKNSLQVDGIAGSETLGHLYSGNTANNAAPSTTPETGTPTLTPLQQAQQLLDQQNQNRPSYEKEWEDQYQNAVNDYASRDKFAYDINQDALYKQLQDQYIAQGQLAMMDAQGQAAALAGGYGTSYGQAVGQQAYQSYLQQLTDKVPELYQLARANYDAEGQELLNRISMLGSMDDREYSRFMDELNLWIADRDYLQGIVDTERNWQYTQQNDEYNKLSQLISMGYDPTEEELLAAGMTRGQANTIQNAYTASQYSGSRVSSEDEVETDNGDFVGEIPYKDWGYDTRSEALDELVAMAEAQGLSAVENFLNGEVRYNPNFSVAARDSFLLDISDRYYELHPDKLPRYDNSFNEYAYNRLEEGFTSGRNYS